MFARPVIGIFLGAIVLAGPGRAIAQSQEPTGLEVLTALPGTVDIEQIQALADRVRPAVFEVRSTTDLGPTWHPRYLHGDGAAVLLDLGDDAPVLVTAFAHVAQCTSVEVRIDDLWVPAEVHRGTPMFDLAVLRVDSPPNPERALVLATTFPLLGNVYAPNVGEAQPPMLVGALGSRPEEPFSYYVRSLFTLRNGFPVVDLEGNVVAIDSIAAIDGGGVFAIPFEHVRLWRQEWDQLDTSSPIGWEPRVRVEPIELETGAGVLTP